MRKKDYPEEPQTLGEHLKKRRKELGLLQREAAARMGIDHFTYINWEKDKTKPVASRFRAVIEFLGFDPTPAAMTLGERLQAKRRTLGITFDQLAQYLGWDRASLFRYAIGTWPLPAARAASLDAFLAAAEADLAKIHGFPRRSTTRHGARKGEK